MTLRHLRPYVQLLRLQQILPPGDGSNPGNHLRQMHIQAGYSPPGYLPALLAQKPLAPAYDPNQQYWRSSAPLSASKSRSPDTYQTVSQNLAINTTAMHIHMAHKHHAFLVICLVNGVTLYADILPMAICGMNSQLVQRFFQHLDYT